MSNAPAMPSRTGPPVSSRTQVPRRSCAGRPTSSARASWSPHRWPMGCSRTSRGVLCPAHGCCSWTPAITSPRPSARGTPSPPRRRSTCRRSAPSLTRAQHEAEFGKLYETNPDLCCQIRKVWPLDQALRPYAAWASGIRRSESATRAQTPVVGWDARRRLVKVSPLARWTDEQVDSYVAEHDILVNPLREIGFASIGCAPCTRPVAPGEDPRAGRWAGRSKTECGIHT